MTLKTATPARLQLALIEYFFADNQPLAGDLLEECAHRSRTWFWRQLMLSIIR